MLISKERLMKLIKIKERERETSFHLSSFKNNSISMVGSTISPFSSNTKSYSKKRGKN